MRGRRRRKKTVQKGGRRNGPQISITFGHFPVLITDEFRDVMARLEIEKVQFVGDIFS
jgi:hypothetical protein